MAKQFNWLSMVPQMHKDCVFGFVRDIQKAMPSTSAYYNIPSLVIYLILDYFYQREAFDIHGERITLTDEQSTASLVQGGNAFWSANSCFGTISVDFNGLYIYEWTIKIIKTASKIAIGMIASERLRENTRVDGIEHGDFTYDSGKDFVAYHGWRNENEPTFEIGWDIWSSQAVGEPYTTGDVIRLKIDSKYKSIEFYKNDKSVGILKNIKGEDIVDTSKQHQLAIIMSGSGAVQILNFNQKNVQ